MKSKANLLWASVLCLEFLFIHTQFSQTWAGDRKLTLEQIFKSDDFAVHGIEGIQWIEDQSFTYLKPNAKNSKLKDIWKYDVKTQRKTLWVSSEELPLGNGTYYSIGHYEIAPGGTQVVFTGTLPSRSIKTGGELYLFDLQSRQFKMILPQHSRSENIQISPDGRHVGYVRDHNLFIYNFRTGRELQVTLDGSDTLLNGAFDWVYEEEFAAIKGWQWSPDGEAIAYWQLDQSNVPTFPLIQYQNPHPTVTQMRYPKAGDPNSIVRIGVYDLVDHTNRWMDLGRDYDSYVPRIQWLPSGDQLIIQRLNRKQNELSLWLAGARSGRIQLLMKDVADTWVDVHDDLHVLEDGKRFIWTSEKKGYRHIYLANLANGDVQQLTFGNWEVDRVNGVDSARQKVYFTSNKDQLHERHLFSVSIKDLTIEKLTRDAGTHSVSFSPKYSYYIDHYSNLRMPSIHRLHDSQGIQQALPEEMLAPALEQYDLASEQFFNFKTSSGDLVTGLMLKPSAIDPNKKYPVLIHVYGGPGYQLVRNQWGGNKGLWHHYLTQNGYIVVLLDHRGTGGQGKAYKSSTYLNLGTQESQDVLEGTKFISQMPEVDSSRIGVWGWSYGGYLSALSMCKAGDLLKSCVSVAPVTDWRYYDTIYTERFMRTPSENPEGYRNSSVMEHVSGLKGSFLLVHGTGDDNVHFQNALAFVAKAVEQDKDIEVMPYPDQNHRIATGKNTQLHLYKKITKFLKNHL
jgi:dipeptidyl-peptidase-4